MRPSGGIFGFCLNHKFDFGFHVVFSLRYASASIFISLLKHVSVKKSIDEDDHSFGITRCRDDWAWDTQKQSSVDYDLWIVLKGNGQSSGGVSHSF